MPHPSQGFGGDISKSTIVDFVDNGGNVLVALAPGASDTVRWLAAECGVELDAKGTQVYDHFSYQAAGGASDPLLVATSAWVDSDAILGAKRPKSPVLFKGIAQAVPTSSELVNGAPGLAALGVTGCSSGSVGAEGSCAVSGKGIGA